MVFEEWIDLTFDSGAGPLRYAISNFGRIKSFKGSNDGKILKGSVIQGYKSLNVKLCDGRSVSKYIHKLVAEAFLYRPSEKHTFVIHLDFDKLNNHFENLKFATRSEMTRHHKTNPGIMNKKLPASSRQFKLTEAKVRQIKKLIKSDTTRMKMIARQFGITYTHLKRIQAGQTWGHVTI